MQPYADAFPDAGRELPVTEAVADRVVVLPTGTAVTPDDIAVICDLVRSPG
jgi:dTDP-4-amino-4,6-dideoxygalactose transaminase